MKKIFIYALICLLAVGCQPDAHKEIGELRPNVASLQGNWQLTRAVQKDEDAASKGFPFTELDLTTLFPYTDFQLKLEGNGSTPTTFSTVRGSSPAVIKLASGNWTVNDPTHPSMITLTSGATTENVQLGSYPVGPRNTLTIKVERRDPATSKLLLSYSYEFTKQ